MTQAIVQKAMQKYFSNVDYQDDYNTRKELREAFKEMKIALERELIKNDKLQKGGICIGLTYNINFVNQIIAQLSTP